MACRQTSICIWSLTGLPEPLWAGIVPFPFGIGRSGCYKDKQFEIMCNTSFNRPKPFLAATGVEVLDISTTGLFHINGPIALNCYTKLGDISTNYSTWINLDEKGPYSLSGSRNRLTAIGCNAVAYVTGSIGDNCTSGCMSLYSPNVLVVNGSCNGIECCQMSIPERRKLKARWGLVNVELRLLGGPEWVWISWVGSIRLQVFR